MKNRIARYILPVLLTALLLPACAGDTGGAPADAAGMELEAHFFSAGSADAILLTTADSAVLVDAGEKGFGKEILACLEAKGVERLDALIITHFDKDHVGGAAKVINSIAIGTVLQSNQPKNSDEYEKYVKALENTGIEPVTVREPLLFELDGVSYSVDPPRQERYAEDSSNNSSLIVSVRNGEHGLLLLGDAQTERLAEFLAEAQGDYQVLKVPHHGRGEPLMAELAKAVSADYAIITSSENEPESAETVAILRAAGAEVLLTREGAVTVRSDGVSLRVTRGTAGK